jgi:hypothetical protein
MVRKRASIGRVFAQAIVFLLLCGIAAREFPELISLTDNATNDFTVTKTDHAASRVLLSPEISVRNSCTDSNAHLAEMLFSRATQVERIELVPSELSILHRILRT